MDLDAEFEHLLENAPYKEIFDILDAKREARQQKEDLVKC